MNLSRLKYPMLIAGTGLLIGLLTDLMIYDQPLGMSVPMTYMLLVVAMLALALRENAAIRFANLWLIVPMLFFAAMFAIRAAPFLMFFNFMAAFALLLLLANRLLDAPLTRLDLWGYAVALVEASVLCPILSIPLIQRAVKAMNIRGNEGSNTTRRVLVGVLLALPFLIVFSLLFASADLVFNNLFSIFWDFSLPDIFGHAIITGILGLLFMGGLAYTLSRPNPLFAVSSPTVAAKDEASTSEAEAPSPTDAPPITTVALPTIKGRLGALEAFIVLFSVDALFLVFVAIQFAALFGGEAFLRSQNLTYSEYARRGFFELLAVAVITLSLILALDYLTGRETPRQRTLFLIGAGLMTLMTIIILGSAYRRMQLYEFAYGFTELRVQTHVFMIWLALLMAVFFVLLLIRRPHLFATAALLFAIGFLASLNILNQDAFIVQQNLARARAGEELDLYYLASLSEDALPQVIPLFENGTPDEKEMLAFGLKTRLISLDYRQRKAGWASYHVSINRAYQLLEPLRGELEDYEIR